MDAFTQLKIVRRMGPAMPLMEGLVSPENLAKDRSIVMVLMFSHISEEDMLFVVHQCLELVDRQGPGDQAPVPVQRNGTVMFDNITMSEMLKIAVAVVEENIGDFFRTTLSELEGKANQTKEGPSFT